MKFCRCWDLNCRSLVSEATALTTEITSRCFHPHAGGLVFPNELIALILSNIDANTGSLVQELGWPVFNNQLSLGDKATRFEPRPAVPTTLLNFNKSNVFWCIQTERFLELLSRRHERECLSGKKTFNFSTPRTLRKCFRQERNSVKSDERRRFDKKL